MQKNASGANTGVWFTNPTTLVSSTVPPNRFWTQWSVVRTLTLAYDQLSTDVSSSIAQQSSINKTNQHKKTKHWHPRFYSLFLETSCIVTIVVFKLHSAVLCVIEKEHTHTHTLTPLSPSHPLSFFPCRKVQKKNTTYATHGLPWQGQRVHTPARGQRGVSEEESAFREPR